MLSTLPEGSVQTCVTSPPYLGLRDYGVAGQIGLETTPEAYLAEMVAVFREVRRVLRDDGTLWLNLGDSYAGSWGAQSRGGPPSASSTLRGNGHVGGGPKLKGLSSVQIEAAPKRTRTGSTKHLSGIKPKDLLMIPARVALALQADGWWLRSDIIWAKPNPMPESIFDRPTSAHEHVFLLSKRASYYYDADAIREPPSEALLRQIAEGYAGRDTKDFANGGAQSASSTKSRIIEGARRKIDKQRGHGRRHDGFNDRWDSLSKAEQMACGSNARNVWSIATQPYSGAHFAVMPEEIARRCILAGSKPGDAILDPFGGAGTTGLVADRLGRNAVLIELNPQYADMARERLRGDCPMFAEVA
jgi:DNA modification methylase